MQKALKHIFIQTIFENWKEKSLPPQKKRKEKITQRKNLAKHFFVSPKMYHAQSAKKKLT